MTPWEQRKAVARMQALIEAHLTEPITIQMLARAARYSPCYAARLFKQHTGCSPFEYIRRRRLTAAAERLEGGTARVTDVAFDFVFDSHEGFTRSFARQFGMPPAAFRRLRPAFERFRPPSLVDYYRLRQKGAPGMTDTKTPIDTVFVQILDRPARKLILRRGREATHYFSYCEEVGCDVWDRLGTIEGALHEPLGLWLPDRFRPEGTSTYAMGVEVPADFAGEVPEGFDCIDLPACKMMVFQGQPFEDESFEAAIASLWDVILTYRPETYGFAWADEDGPRFQLAPLGYRGYIEGRPVRAISGPA